jgi:hypothetical protein
MDHEQWLEQKFKDAFMLHPLVNNQGSNALLKDEGFVSDEGSEVEKLKPVY